MHGTKPLKRFFGKMKEEVKAQIDECYLCGTGTSPYTRCPPHALRLHTLQQDEDDGNYTTRSGQQPLRSDCYWCCQQENLALGCKWHAAQQEAKNEVEKGGRRIWMDCFYCGTGDDPHRRCFKHIFDYKKEDARLAKALHSSSATRATHSSTKSTSAKSTTTKSTSNKSSTTSNDSRWVPSETFYDVARSQAAVNYSSQIPPTEFHYHSAESSIAASSMSQRAMKNQMLWTNEYAYLNPVIAVSSSAGSRSSNDWYHDSLSSPASSSSRTTYDNNMSTNPFEDYSTLR